MSLEGLPRARSEVERPSSLDDDFNVTVSSEFNNHIISDAQEQITNPFVPFEGAPTEPIINIITPRAVLIGSLCGALVNASNIYLGLKAGWTTSANILGAIVGFSVLKKWTAGTDRPFGPHENNIVQTVATASGGISNVFISAIPALYQLGLLRTPIEDFFWIITLTAIGGYFGLLSIVPLRKFFIEHVASELNLVFPSSMATAITIRSMHSAANGEQVATLKMRAIIYAFIAALTLRVASQLMPGVFWNWHIFTWFAELGVFPGLCVAAESWGWSLEWSPAMLGSGMLVDFGVACSFFGGSVLAWGVIGPYIVARGIATGKHISTKPRWTDFMSYAVMSSEFASAAHPSPRYWLLWPGVACTLTVASVELACQWRIFWKFGVLSVVATTSTLRRIFQAGLFSRYSLLNSEEKAEGGSSPETNKGDIATWMWAPGVVVLVILAGVALQLQFEMSVLEVLLALFLSFCLSLVAIQSTGATDTTPLNAISKVSQVILSGVTRAAGGSVTDAQRLNLLGASLTNIGASQGVDLMGDFRVGFLLGTPPYLQYAAQLLGTFVATMVAPSVFVLFTKAYPCIIANAEDQAADHVCQFPGPAVASWRAVAIAASEPDSPIPPTSVTFSIGFAVVSGLLTLLKQVFFIGRLSFLRKYQPNLMILALAFTLPTPQTSITMMVGAIIAKVWKRKRPGDFEQLGLGVAAGLVAGEGIGGTINCIISILGIGGERWTSNIGCPVGIC